MQNRKNWFQALAGLILFLAILVLYFKFTDRGRHEIVIPSKDNVDGDLAQVTGLITTMSFDFDSPEMRQDSTAFIGGKAYSGTFSNILNSDREYSTGIVQKWSDVKQYSAVREIRFKFWCFSETPLSDVVAVFSIDSIPGTTINWQSMTVAAQSGKWSMVTVNFTVSEEFLVPSYQFKLFVWNRSKQTFLLDDFSVEFHGGAASVKNDNHYLTTRSLVNDFETHQDGNLSGYVSDNVHSGKFAFRLTANDAYSPALVRKISEITTTSISLISLGAWIYPTKDDLEGVLVVTIKKPNGNEYLWEGRSTDKGRFEKGKWTKHRAQFKLPSEKISKDDVISAYVWNKGGTDIIVDDLEVVYGEQQSRMGNDPLVDMVTVPETGYTFKRNTAPFQTLLFSQSKIIAPGMSNPDPTLSKTQNQMLPGELICAGRFLKNSELSQVVRIKDSKLEVYGYCEMNKQFRLLFNGELPFKAGNQIIAAMDADGDKTDELIIANDKQTGFLFRLTSMKDACSKTPDVQRVEPWKEFNLPVNIQDSFPVYDFICVDRNSDGKNEFLVTNSVTHETSITEISGDKISTTKVEGDFLSDEGEYKLLLWDGGYLRNSGKLYCVQSAPSGNKLISYSWNKAQNSFTKSVATDFLPASMIDKSSCLISLKPLAGQLPTLYLMNNNWKFDLKKINFSNEGFYVASQVDFRNTAIESNPKFFEFNKVLSGHFISKNNSELMVISGNCADEGFSGISCTTYEGAGSVGLFVSE